MDKLRVTILGTGNIAATMAETMAQMEEVELMAAASRTFSKAEAFAAAHGFKKAYGSYEEAAGDPETDLIYIATPHSEHAVNTKLCLEQGKHVLCEKAFAVNEKEAQEMIALAEEKHLLLAEAIWVRYMPMAETLRRTVDSGVIGKPLTLNANLAYLVSHNKRLVDPALAGGALLDVGVYTLTFASIAFGDAIEKIDTCAVMTDTGVDAQNSITLTYRDGRMAVLNSSIVTLSDRQGAIYGTKGYILVDNINNFEALRVYDTERKLIETHIRPEQISGYEYQIRACKEAIEQGLTECPQMPHGEILEIMRQMDAVRRSWGLLYPMEEK